VGTVLARGLCRAGHEVVVLSRRNLPSDRWRVVQWDGRNAGDWIHEIDGADVVINLAGQSVNCRYHARNRRVVKDSRIHSTRAVREAIRGAARPPAVWLQASTATIYEHRFDPANDEFTGRIGGTEPKLPDTWRFSYDVATSWEREALGSRGLPATRLVLMRTAIVMAPDRGGPFDMLLRLARWGLGGRMGSGRQFVSWVHDRDLLRAVEFLIAEESIAGPVNIASPNPLPNTAFMHDLREAWGIPFGLPATEWMLEFGALLLRTETELVLKSRRVVPGVLASRGFDFEFPEWKGAAQDLCSRWREAARTWR
jgi:Predicted nucleoside-diphosphate sugar epimerase